MKEAFGGILSLVLIVTFLLIVMGVLGLTVAYTKAFRMKNNVISRIEQYEGQYCFKDDTRGNSYKSACKTTIHKDAEKLGYSPTIILNCPNGYDNIDDLFCVKKVDSVGKTYKQKNYSYDGVSKNGNIYCPTYYYEIVTQVDINIPIINKILGMNFFQVGGATRTIVSNNCNNDFS